MLWRVVPPTFINFIKTIFLADVLISEVEFFCNSTFLSMFWLKLGKLPKEKSADRHAAPITSPLSDRVDLHLKNEETKAELVVCIEIVFGTNQ